MVPDNFQTSNILFFDEDFSYFVFSVTRPTITAVSIIQMGPQDSNQDVITVILFITTIKLPYARDEPIGMEYQPKEM